MFALLQKKQEGDHVIFPHHFPANIGKWSSLIFLSNQRSQQDASLRAKPSEQTFIRPHSRCQTNKISSNTLTGDQRSSLDLSRPKVIRLRLQDVVVLIVHNLALTNTFLKHFCQKGHLEYENQLRFTQMSFRAERLFSRIMFQLLFIVHDSPGLNQV